MPSTTIDYIKIPKVERKNVHTFTLHPLDSCLHTLMKIYCLYRNNILYKILNSPMDNNLSFTFKVSSFIAITPQTIRRESFEKILLLKTSFYT